MRFEFSRVLALVLMGVLGFSSMGWAQNTGPSVPEPNPLPGQGGGAGGGASVPDKLDLTLRAALEQILDRNVSPLIVAERLGLDLDAKLRVLVEVTALGNPFVLQARIEALGGELVLRREVGGGLPVRIPIRRLTDLAVEPLVSFVVAPSRAAASVPPALDIETVIRDLPANAVAAIREVLVEKRSRTLAQRKVDSGLLLAEQRRQNQNVANGVLARVDPRLTFDPEQRVLVEVGVGNQAQNVVNLIQRLGGRVVSRVDRFRSLQAWMPLGNVESLAEFAGVRNIRRAIPPVTRIKPRSEGDVRHRADIIRSEYGLDGDGVKIGVMSNGIDTLSARQANGDLPGDIEVLSGQAGSGDEGTAILEIVNDLAPGASLMFASGFPTEAQMAANILALADAGCDVIFDDVGHLLAPAFQDGPAAQAVETVSDRGVIYLSAAGNDGNLDAGTSGVWEGDFKAAELVIEGETYIVHDFGGGVLFNELGSDPLGFITLQWADPFGAAANDYDLLLLDDNGGEIIALSNNVQDGEGDPLEYIDSRLDDHIYYRIVVVQAAGDDRYFRLDTFGSEIEFATGGQIFGHPAAASAFAVGAVFQGNGQWGPGYFDGDEVVEAFSSDGPRRIFYESDGTPYTPGILSSEGGMIRSKPDFVAADGVSTNTPFFEQFFGTSAAVPHVAGIVALLKQRGVEDAARIRRLLETTAIDIEAPGFDRKSGFGIVDAFSALLAPLGIEDELSKPFAPELIIESGQVLGNDLSGVGNGELSLMDGEAETENGGTVSIEDNVVVYRPPPGFRGLDRFSYSVVEDNAGSSIGSVTIEVTDPVNQPVQLQWASGVDGGWFLEFNGAPGGRVSIEQRAALTSETAWQSVEEITLDDEGSLQWAVPTVEPAGFYRAVSF